MNTHGIGRKAQVGATVAMADRSVWLRRFAGLLVTGALFSLGLALPLVTSAGSAADAPVGLGPNATGEDLKEKMQKTFDEVEKALKGKRNAGTITEDESEILDSLIEARTALDDTDPADLDAIATLASGKAIEVVPDAEAQAAGIKTFTFTAADLVKAQEDAIKMSEAAEAFAKSDAGRALEAVAHLQDSDAASRSSGNSRSVWTSKDTSGDRNVTAAAATDGLASLFPDPESAEVPTNSIDAVDFGILNWVFGGFHPATNCVRTAVELSRLKMKQNGLSFSYVRDLSSWGYASDDYSGALACLFVCDADGRWVGGKFDWISSSRNKRDFANVYSGYHGWNLSNVPNPTTAAFVIVSKNGKRRSNVISALWER